MESIRMLSNGNNIMSKLEYINEINTVQQIYEMEIVSCRNQNTNMKYELAKACIHEIITCRPDSINFNL